jgi:hypothetical protein
MYAAMNKFLHHLRTSERGLTALLITIVVLVIGVALLLSVAFVFLNRLESSRNIGLSEQAYFAAEAGAEDILLRFFDSSKALPVSYPHTLSVGGGQASSTLTTDLFGSITVDAQGDRANRTRSVQVVLGVDTAVGSIAFGAQVGDKGIIMDSNSEVDGNVFSNGNIIGLSNTRIEGDAISVGTITSPNPIVAGTREEGASPIPLPFINADAWRAAANVNNDPIVGGLSIGSGTTILGPRRIDGNLTLGGSSTLIVTGPLYITGDLTMNSNSIIKLDNSFGSNGTVVITDGVISFSSNADVEGTTADPKGYLLLASTAATGDAIVMDANSILEGILYAINADLRIRSNGGSTAIIGNGIQLESNASITYDLGLITHLFTTGGTVSYAIIDWKEQ